MRDILITERAKEIRRIARQHGAHRVRVFGSRARGEASTSSEVDLLVDFEPGRDLLDLVALKQDLEQLLTCRVDVVEEEGLSPYLRQRVVGEARVVCGRGRLKTSRAFVPGRRRGIKFHG